MLASPLNPSMIFIALEIPARAKTVKKKEIAVICKSLSATGRSTLTILIFKKK